MRAGLGLVYLFEAKRNLELGLGMVPSKHRPKLEATLRRLSESLEDLQHNEDDDPPCSGSGYAHAPHGRCPGYSTDRT